MATGKKDEDRVVSLAIKIPCDLSKRLKHYSVDSELSQQEITILALESYLAKREKTA
jgi:hypothetical protein